MIFRAESSCFYDEDRAMDGMTAVHLAAKYDAITLSLIIDFLQTTKKNVKNNPGSSSMTVAQVVEIRNDLMEMTPLHIAADGKSSSATRSAMTVLVCLTTSLQSLQVSHKTLYS